MKPAVFLVLLPFLSLVIGAPTPIASRDVNSFLAAIARLFPFGGILADIEGLLTTALATLAHLFGTQTTQNGLSGSCGAITVVFARGTVEPGNVGIVAGPPFFDALESIVGASNVVVQGVTYPADVEGFLAGGDATGSQNMANLIQQTQTTCPGTKIIISGYSQGAQLVHNAARLLPASVMAAVSSVVMFGDPDNGAAVEGIASSQTLVICHDDDLICQHTDIVMPDHLTYAENAAQAASFAATRAGF